MKWLVVDQISGRLCSFVVREDGVLDTHEIHTIPIALKTHLQTQKYYTHDYKHLCFDAFKVMSVFGFKFPFLYDVKVLYELEGLRFKNLIDLAREVLGENRVKLYISLSNSVKAHLKSYQTAKIDHRKFSRDKLIPEWLLKKFYLERSNLILELYNKFNNKEVLDFYKSYFYNVLLNLHYTSLRPLSVDLDMLDGDDSHYAEVIRKYEHNSTIKLYFNAVGAKTGRVSFKEGTFNIYTLPKRLRQCIVSPQDYQIVQFDFKSFQPRLAIFLTDDEEFKNRFKQTKDIYSLFPGDRNTNKIAFLAWMFSLSRNEMFEKEAYPIYKLRTKLFHEAKKYGRLINPYGRYLKFHQEEKNVVFQNYITSVEVDCVLNCLIKLNKMLIKHKSKVMFPFHDAIVCKIHKDELQLVDKIRNVMSFMFNKDVEFPIEVKSGDNFYEV